jgi:hypothetical protein
MLLYLLVQRDVNKIAHYDNAHAYKQNGVGNGIHKGRYGQNQYAYQKDNYSQILQ